MHKLAVCFVVISLSSCDGSGSSPSTEGTCAATLDGATPLPDAALSTQDESCCAVPGSLISYLHSTTTDTTDTRCGPISNGMCTIDLEGFLYVPSGAKGPLPAIVYNHGSEPLPGPKCPIADYFVPRGYVVFVPHRRGQGKSTGKYIGTYTSGTQISYLEDQVGDVTAAWNYLKGLTAKDGSMVVDSKRMAITGHSYGGIVTLLTNATKLGQVAAVDLCGDSESWGTGNEPALLTAVDGAQSPIFFAQPQNDVHTDPTAVYSHEAWMDKQQFQATIYPPVPNAGTPEDAHVMFVRVDAQVALWGSGVLDFLHRYGM